MKKISAIVIVMLLSAVIAGNAYAQGDHNARTSNPKLKILYFHATMRCPTCLAIENNARKLLESNFKAELDNGTLEFVSYNVDEKENKPLVDKYQITFSTLLLVKSDGTKTDFTANAFQYALANPAKYTSLLSTEIEKNLNE